MKNIKKNLLNLPDVQLLEHLQLYEEFLLEATWTNKRQFERHYNDHVLQDDEEFSPDNPKFAHIDELEYKNMAKKFSELPADKATYRVFYNEDGSVKNRLMNTRSNVIGFILTPDVNKFQRITRKAKIVKTPKEYLPDGVSGEEYRTLVVYVDDGGEEEIISCYLLRPKKMFGIFKYQFQDELPENQSKEEKEITTTTQKEEDSTGNIINESITLIVDKPYMMRNDGEVFKVEYKNRRIADHPYIIRNPEDISIQDARIAIMNGIDDIDWFFNHTNSKHTQDSISRFCEYAINVLLKEMLNSGEASKQFVDKKTAELSKYITSSPNVVPIEGGEDEMLDALLIANESVNQEFLRFRTGKDPNNSTKLNLYFRVSSIGFDWVNLIDNFILDNYSAISSITITRDPWALGNYEAYTVDGKDTIVMSVDEWLRHGKNAIIESIQKTKCGGKFNKYLKEGLSVSDIFWNCNPKHTAQYIKKANCIKQ